MSIRHTHTTNIHVAAVLKAPVNYCSDARPVLSRLGRELKMSSSRSFFDHQCGPFFSAFRILGFCPYTRDLNGKNINKKKCIRIFVQVDEELGKQGYSQWQGLLYFWVRIIYESIPKVKVKIILFRNVRNSNHLYDHFK